MTCSRPKTRNSVPPSKASLKHFHATAVMIFILWVLSVRGQRDEIHLHVHILSHATHTKALRTAHTRAEIIGKARPVDERCISTKIACDCLGCVFHSVYSVKTISHATTSLGANGNQDPGSLEDLPGKTEMDVDQSEGEQRQGDPHTKTSTILRYPMLQIFFL